jgi:hypothetical protein
MSIQCTVCLLLFDGQKFGPRSCYSTSTVMWLTEIVQKLYRSNLFQIERMARNSRRSALKRSENREAGMPREMLAG